VCTAVMDICLIDTLHWISVTLLDLIRFSHSICIWFHHPVEVDCVHTFRALVMLFYSESSLTPYLFAAYWVFSKLRLFILCCLDLSPICTEDKTHVVDGELTRQFESLYSQG
jgi:hypothetical protein